LISKQKGERKLSESKRISPLIGAVLFLLVISVAGYFAIRDLAGTQSQQQQSVSPIFGLIESELVEPLHMATTLDKIGV
jgi:CHASE3 domain sensor protein